MTTISATTLAAGTLALGLLVAAPAFAHRADLAVSGSASAIGDGGATADMQTTKNRNQRPIGELFGAPVVISAPVDAPYNSSAAYGTYEGQPGYGPNAVLAASNESAP